MTLVSNLTDLQLSLTVGRVAFPLSALTPEKDEPTAATAASPKTAASPEDEDEDRLDAPEIRPPALGDAFKLKPMRKIRIPEWISHVRSGVVTIHLPLPERTLKKSLLEIDLTAGHTLVLEVVARDGDILYDTCTGSIEPPIKLPLGISLKGIEINEDGEIVAVLSGLPDINLTRWVSAVPTIPSTVDGLVHDLLGWSGPEEETAPEPSPESDDDGASDAKPYGDYSSVTRAADETPAFDLSLIRVSARDILPTADEPLDLGAAGSITLTQDSLLRVDYRKGRLAIRGSVALSGAELCGNGFSLSGVRGTARIEYIRGEDTLIALSDLSATATRLDLNLPNGTAFTVGPLELSGTTVDFANDADGDITFRAAVSHVEAALQSGRVVLGVEEHDRVIAVDPTDIAGSLTVAKGEAELDIAFGGLGLDLDALPLELGPLSLSLTAIRADGSGRMTGSTRTGFNFTGAYTVATDVSHSNLTGGVLRAHLDEGSQAIVSVHHLSTHPEHGLTALQARGGIHLELHSGSVPLAGDARLYFEDGGSGTLTVNTLGYDHTQAYPTLDAHLSLDASSAPTSLADLANLPSGNAHLEAHVQLGAKGMLSLTDIALTLNSEEEEEEDGSAAQP